MTDERLAALVDSLQPLVIINRPSMWDFAPSLSIDYRSGIHSLAEHLYQLGHRDLLFLNGPGRSPSNLHRLRALDDIERDHDDLRVTRLDCGVSSDDGFGATQAVVESGASAVLAYNDLVAVGLMHGLTGLGTRVPRRHLRHRLRRDPVLPLHVAAAHHGVRALRRTRHPGVDAAPRHHQRRAGWPQPDVPAPSRSARRPLRHTSPCGLDVRAVGAPRRRCPPSRKRFRNDACGP